MSKKRKGNVTEKVFNPNRFYGYINHIVSIGGVNYTYTVKPSKHYEFMKENFIVENLPEEFDPQKPKEWKNFTNDDFLNCNTHVKCKCGIVISVCKKYNYESHLKACLIYKSRKEKQKYMDNWIGKDKEKRKKEFESEFILNKKNDNKENEDTVKKLINFHYRSIKAIAKLFFSILTICKNNFAIHSFQSLQKLLIACDCRDVSLQTYVNDEGASELLEILSEEIKQELYDSFSKSPTFSFTTDESPDISLKKQVIYYVTFWNENIVETKFLEIHSVEKTKGKDLFDDYLKTIYRFILKYGKNLRDEDLMEEIKKCLDTGIDRMDISEENFNTFSDHVDDDDSKPLIEKDPKKFVKERGAGGTGDGCTSMRSEKVGFNKEITEYCVNSLWWWCVCHRVSLFSKAIKDLESVEEVFDVCSDVCKFFRKSPLRIRELETLFSDVMGGDGFALSAFPTKSATRWNFDEKQIHACWKNLEGIWKYSIEGKNFKNSNFKWLSVKGLKFKKRCKKFEKKFCDYSFVLLLTGVLDLLGYCNEKLICLQKRNLQFPELTTHLGEIYWKLVQLSEVKLGDDGEVKGWFSSGGYLNQLFQLYGTGQDINIGDGKCCFKWKFTFIQEYSSICFDEDFNSKNCIEAVLSELRKSVNNVKDSFCYYFPNLDILECYNMFSVSFYQPLVNYDINSISFKEFGLKELIQTSKKLVKSGTLSLDVLKNEFNQFKIIAKQKRIWFVTSNVDLDHQEIESGKEFLRICKSGPDSSNQTHSSNIRGKNYDLKSFQSLSDLFRFCMILIPHSCDAERGFSVMSDIKRKKRNRLTDKHLNEIMNIKMNGPSIEKFKTSDLLFKCVCNFLKKKKERFFLGLENQGNLSQPFFDDGLLKNYLIENM